MFKVHTVLAIAGMAALAGAAVAQPPPPGQQPPAAATKPLKVAAVASDVITMVEAPLAAPKAPFEHWEWAFNARPLTMGQTTYDVTASRVKVDCGAGTRRTLYVDVFMGTALIGRSNVNDTPTRPPKGSIAEGAQEVVCGAVDVSTSRAYATVAEAYAAAKSHFARK